MKKNFIIKISVLVGGFLLIFTYINWSADYYWAGMDPKEDGVRVVY